LFVKSKYKIFIKYSYRKDKRLIFPVGYADFGVDKGKKLGKNRV
jgi:hypothetical protein